MIKILIAGDFCPNYRVTDLIEQQDYSAVFGNIPDLIKDSDLSIVNLECPVISKKARPIPKHGSNLFCTEKGIESLKFAGFKMAALANNHFYDFGEEGVRTTLQECHNYGIHTIGGGTTPEEAAETFYIETGGIRLGILNFCEHEFSISEGNRGGSNPLNPVSNYYQISQAKKQADYVIVMVHGGHEYYHLPSPRMQETYRFFADAGADAVINNHQHCISGFEIYKRKPVFYGQGNFSFDWKNPSDEGWNKGFLICLKLGGPTVEFELHPFVQGSDIPGVQLLENKDSFIEHINRLNSVISNPEKLSEAFDSFVAGNRMNMLLSLEPYTNRYLKALRRRNWLPSAMSRKKLLEIRNYIECESHKDVLTTLLKQIS
jgi:hypothetical protein